MIKKPAAREIKVLIAKMRALCEEIGDCPIKAARDPSQLDCISCILQDVETMAKELASLRLFKEQLTQYGTTVTKLEGTLKPESSGLLKSQIQEK